MSTYHFDVRGSTVALTDAAGNVTDGYAYDSFGVLANRDGDSPQPFRYLGRHGIMDDSSGLCYARARHFNPQLGRFLTKDPLTGRDSDGQSLNRYVYALNNPLRFGDYTGLSPRELTSMSSGDPFLALYEKLMVAGCPLGLGEDIRRCILTTPPGVNLDSNIASFEKLRAILEDYPTIAKSLAEVLRYSTFYLFVHNKGPWDYKQLDRDAFEAFGNYHYGAVGRAIGIPPRILLGAAGVAGVVASTSESQNGLPFLSPLNGDNAVDQYWILRGIEYYDSNR